MVSNDDSISPIRPISGDRIFRLGSDLPLRSSGSKVGRRPGEESGGFAGGFAEGIDPVDTLKLRLQLARAELSFEEDENSGKIVVRLKDPRTGELIRQIPSEEMLKIASAMDENLGLLVDGHR
jgi:hypothetical protein